jgi:sterol desaturase/sphingolipid hydroxylase (fatty acid hydroxylase superfamily)
MNLVPYAIPFFILLILLELAWGWHTKNPMYRINDALNSLMLGVLSTSTGLVALDIGGRVFATIEQDISWWHWSAQSTWAWIGGILLYDFCYYWFHRISHERQILWASHVAHHQSEEYNLSTALRQTSTSFLLAWIFYLPCFLLGMPISMFVTIASAHLIYQFWIHTRFIPKLGPFEWVFISPSNHRVHHGQNPEYIDKNHGGLLIIWDRLFGTFAEEDTDKQTIYGVRTVLHSWNPLWANMQIYWQMICDAWHTQNRADKRKIWWSRTGWRPADVIDRYPLEKSNLADFKKYDANPGRLSSWLLAAHFSFILPLIVSYEAVLAPLPLAYSWIYILLLFFTFYILGAALENKRDLMRLEMLRWVLVVSALLASRGVLSPTLLAWTGAYLAVSAVLMVLALQYAQQPCEDNDTGTLTGSVDLAHP